MLKKIRPIALCRSLKKIDRTVYFPDEGNTGVVLPEIGLLKAFLPSNKRLVKNYLAFIERPSKEILLRKLVYELYQQGVLDRNKSIIDIGAWIADNTIVWSRMISDNAKVFAIDPAEENIRFGKELAELNQCRNISWHQAVCSDEVGQSLFFAGKIGHAQFSESKSRKYKPSPLKSSTLDSIVGESNYDRIGFVHVDVEGFEKKVLAGASQIIAKSRPAILFEQHMTSENPYEIHEHLKPLGYRTYMINEVLPGCSLDCRNFLAVPEQMDLSFLKNRDFSRETPFTIWPAAVGGPLIEL